MTKIQVSVEVSDDHYHRYEGEARRQGVPVEALVECTVNSLWKEFEDEERVSSDRTIFLC